MQKRIMNLVNFVRGCEPRQPWQDLYSPIKEEIAINKSYGVDHTVLMQYDALIRPDMAELMKTELDEHMELGLWFEMGRPLTEAVGIEWRGRPGYDWDWFVNPGFLPAYTPEQREALIDEAFRLFKETFGFYPKVAGSWLLDTHSVNYMSDKYDLSAICICREQWGVDAYTLWGGYYSGGYYPSRNNMLCPAGTPEAGCRTPIFRMLGIDPIYGFDESKYTDKLSGCPTMEPVWGPGADPNVVDWYLETYYKNPCLTFSQMTTGQENSFGWDWIQNGYRMQAEKIAAYRDKGLLTVQKLGDTGADMRASMTVTPATALTAYEDWAHDGSDPARVCRSVWYSCANYRVNIFQRGNQLFIRDLNKFDDRYTERFTERPCEAWDAVYDNLPMVDGRIWSRDGKDCALSVEFTVRPEGFTCVEHGQALEVILRFENGIHGLIYLSPKGISFEGCGILTYSVGVPHETTVAYEDGEFRYTHNGYDYALPVTGCRVEEAEEGYRLVPTGAVRLDMSKR